MDREDKVAFLVDSDYAYIMQSDSGLELLNSYLQFGFKGYEQFTDAELDAEIEQRKLMESL